MEIVEGMPRIRIHRNEQIYEAIKLIKPDAADNRCRFFMGNIWQVQSPTYDGDKMLYRTYELIKRHVYIIQANGQPDLKLKETYVKVSSVGNIDIINREEACEIVETRKGYVLDTDLTMKDEPSEEIPEPVCDW